MAAHRNSRVITEMANKLYACAWGSDIQISFEDARDLALAAHEGWEKVYMEIYTKERA